MNKRQKGKRVRRSRTRFARRWCLPQSSRWTLHSPLEGPRARLGRPDKFYADYGSQFAGRRLPTRSVNNNIAFSMNSTRVLLDHVLVKKPTMLSAGLPQHLLRGTSIGRYADLLQRPAPSLEPSATPGSNRLPSAVQIRRAAQPRTALHLPVRRVRSGNRDLS